MPDRPDKRTLERLREGLDVLAGHDGRGPAHVELVAFARRVRELGDGVGVTVDLGADAILGQPMVILREREGPPPLFDALTRRERDVAELVAKGLRNKEIAAALGIGVATVKDHVHAILRKSGLESRTEIAAEWR